MTKAKSGSGRRYPEMAKLAKGGGKAYGLKKPGKRKVPKFAPKGASGADKGD